MNVPQLLVAWKLNPGYDFLNDKCTREVIKLICFSFEKSFADNFLT